MPRVASHMGAIATTTNVIVDSEYGKQEQARTAANPATTKPEDEDVAAKLERGAGSVRDHGTGGCKAILGVVNGMTVQTVLYFAFVVLFQLICNCFRVRGEFYLAKEIMVSRKLCMCHATPCGHCRVARVAVRS